MPKPYSEKEQFGGKYWQRSFKGEGLVNEKDLSTSCTFLTI